MTVTVIGKLIEYKIIEPRKNPRLTIESWKVKDKTGIITCNSSAKTRTTAPRNGKPNKLTFISRGL